MSEPENDILIINPNKKSIWTIRWYLFFFCLIVLCQSMITSGYIGSIVSSIEMYYGFSTERLGIAFSSYDIIGVISIPLISYYGSKLNRAKIVAIGSFLFSIGNILFILPYFIKGYKEINLNNISNETSDYFCSNKSILFNENSNEIIESKWIYFLFIFSMIIMSIGSSPFYTLGITYLTDNLNKDDQPIYTSNKNKFKFD
jgi:MFS family permease